MLLFLLIRYNCPWSREITQRGYCFADHVSRQRIFIPFFILDSFLVLPANQQVCRRSHTYRWCYYYQLRDLLLSIGSRVPGAFFKTTNRESKRRHDRVRSKGGSTPATRCSSDNRRGDSRASVSAVANPRTMHGQGRGVFPFFLLLLLLFLLPFLFLFLSFFLFFLFLFFFFFFLANNPVCYRHRSPAVFGSIVDTLGLDLSLAWERDRNSNSWCYRFRPGTGFLDSCQSPGSVSFRQPIRGVVTARSPSLMPRSRHARCLPESRCTTTTSCGSSVSVKPTAGTHHLVLLVHDPRLMLPRIGCRTSTASLVCSCLPFAASARDLKYITGYKDILDAVGRHDRQGISPSVIDHSL